MKKKLISLLLVSLPVAMLGGCKSENTKEIPTVSFEAVSIAQTEGTIVEEERMTEEKESITDETENMTEEQTDMLVETEVAQITELTFADLAERQFGFCSGAGAWSEDFTIEKDGYFTGRFHDADMGHIGEGFENGTYYTSSYSGHFTELTKIDNQTYTMKLADISYKETPETVEISDGMRFIYTDSYCLGGTDTFTIYLPGTPMEELSEEVYSWINSMNQSETELTMIVIADETNGYGIYSYERQAPLEDAQMTFDSYKESYEYYGDKVSEASTTLEMTEYAESMYEITDDCLNYIWNLIRYHVEEEKFNEILAEQRDWIAEKEEKAKEVMASYGEGSLAAVSYHNTLATLTMDRCEELIEYLK